MNMKKDDGFTLIEVTLAMTVLVVGILATLMIILTCIQQREVSREMDLAKNAATAKVQEIRAYDFDTVDDYYSVTGTTFTVDGLVAQGAIPLGSVVITNTNPELLDILVRIRWLSVTQANQELRMHTMLTRTE